MGYVHIRTYVDSEHKKAVGSSSQQMSYMKPVSGSNARAWNHQVSFSWTPSLRSTSSISEFRVKWSTIFYIVRPYVSPAPWVPVQNRGYNLRRVKVSTPQVPHVLSELKIENLDPFGVCQSMGLLSRTPFKSTQKGRPGFVHVALSLIH